MKGNEKAEHAVKLLRQYAKECSTLPRSTSDLSPLEEWLIIDHLRASNLKMIPTSLRFKTTKEAKHWNTDTKTWHPIEEIHNTGDGRFDISTNSFAWVSFDLKDVDKCLEFKYNEIHPEEIFEDNGEW
jgi:hypothetical protein